MQTSSKSVMAALAASLIATAAPLKDVERQRLVAHIELTRAWLLDEVSGLSTEQLQFHSREGAWSVAEVVEHLRIAEPIYWQQLKDAVKAPASEEKPAATDADVLWYGIDRTQRQKTEARKTPGDAPRHTTEGLDAFRKLHAEILDYARNTQADLRSHLVPKEGVDAYQWILGISTHTMRHILQIREVKADPNFPRKQ